MAYCKVCKEEIVEGSKFCVKCGTPIETREKEWINADEQTSSLDKQQGEIGTVQTINEENVPHLANNTVLENKDTKKSKKKLMIGILSAGVVGVLAIIAVVLLMVFNKTAKVDIGSFVLVEYSGYDTIGEAVVKIDEDELIEAVADSLEKDEDDVEEDIKRLVESFSYEISENGELANGDKVKIIVKYDEEMAEECNLEIFNTSFSDEVVNLQKLTEIDPFQYLKIKFEGCSGDGSVSIEKDITSEAVKDLNFIIDKDSGLYNGDKITISLEESESKKGLELGYKFTTANKEYEVADLSSFYESLDDISEEKMKAINEVSLEEAVKARYKSIKDYVELDENIDYLGSYFIKDVQESENNIIISIFECNVKSLDGSFGEKELYLPVKISNLYYGNNDFIQASMETLGSTNVRGKDYVLPGYLSDNELYTKELYQYIEGNEASNYVVEVSDGVTSQLFSERIEEKIYNSEPDDSDINILIENYIEAAYIKADLEAMKSVVDDVSNIDINLYKSRKKYIESYENVSCYVLETTVINEYIVYVTYDAKLYNIETLAPSSETFIVKYNADKAQYYIHNISDGEQYLDYQTVFNSVMVQQLASAVEKRLTEALNKDLELKEIFEMLINVEATSEVKKVLDMDLAESYPVTASGVVEFFTSIQKCYYNENYTEDEFLLLAHKATELFDAELIKVNPFTEYVSSLEKEVEEYKKENRKIEKILISDASDVRYTTIDSSKYAELECTYYLKDNESTNKITETYVLRQDESGRWKILGWKKYQSIE